MKKRKILYISGTRADYGLMNNTLKLLRKSFSVEIAVTGMHLMKEFGYTISDIESDNFIVHKINTVYKDDVIESTPVFLANFIINLTNKIKEINPDFILLLGDRAEMLGGAVIGTYMSIPVIHIHGGDVSGHVDDYVRHAITKLSDIHLAASVASADKLRTLGEDPRRIYITGAPGLDDISSKKYSTKIDVFRKFSLDSSKKILLVIQHPVSTEFGKESFQMTETMESIKSFCENNFFQAVIIYPNSDPGGRKMIDVIDKYRKYNFIKIFKNLSRDDFLDILNNTSVMIGNSSSGIIESSMFELPVINIGSRQSGRERASNVIDCSYRRDDILNSLKKALYDKKFINAVKKCKTPYGDGTAGIKIFDILSKIKVNKKYNYK